MKLYWPEAKGPVLSRRTARAACNGKALSVQHATIVHGAIKLLTRLLSDGQTENSSKAVWRMEYGGLMFDVEASFACLPIFLTNLTRLYI